MTLKNNWVDVVDSFYAADQNAVANAVNTAVQGSSNGTPTALIAWVGSASQYAAIDPKDSSTLYFVTA